MNSVLKWSVILAVVVAVMTLGLALSGMHTNPLSGIGFVIIAIVMNIVAVVFALKATAAENTYGQQLVNGLLLGVIAGALIFVVSFSMLSFIFPDYIDEMRAGAEEFYVALADQGAMTDAQVEQAVQALEGVTPFNQALQGLIGTALTSLIAGAIVAIFLRKK